jgi:hypothetical protein
MEGIQNVGLPVTLFIGITQSLFSLMQKKRGRPKGNPDSWKSLPHETADFNIYYNGRYFHKRHVSCLFLI